MRGMLSLLAAGVAGSACAQTIPPTPIISFGFNGLIGDFDSTTDAFTVGVGDLTAGDVTSLVTGESAEFEMGFALEDSDADVIFSISVANITANSATGTGTFLITDANGDQIGGDLAGTFRLIGPFIAFSGRLENVFANDVTGDNQFNGVPDTTSFINDFSDFITPFEGAIVQLSLNTGGFFSSDFDGLVVEVNGLIQAFVPAPGTFAGLAAAGLFAARRRRSA